LKSQKETVELRAKARRLAILNLHERATTSTNNGVESVACLNCWSVVVRRAMTFAPWRIQLRELFRHQPFSPDQKWARVCERLGSSSDHTRLSLCGSRGAKWLNQKWNTGCSTLKWAASH